MALTKKTKQKMLAAAAFEALETKTLLIERRLDDIIAMADGIRKIIKRGGTVYLAGNGGSAADCQHFATELVVRLTGKFERPSLPAVALTVNGSLLTAAGNDYGFTKIFARQVESLVTKKDLLIVISTSGNSQNLVEAAKAARKNGAKIFALLGGNGGKLRRYADGKVIVPAESVQRIQEEHIFIIHNLVALIEQDIFA